MGATDLVAKYWNAAAAALFGWTAAEAIGRRVVEAVSSHRPYRPALGMRAALEIVVAGRGTLFDPDVVDACGRLARTGQLDDLVTLRPERDGAR